MNKILREPLLHFLLIGAAIFLLYNQFAPQEDPGEIIIDNYLIGELSSKWEMQHNRPPTLDELEKAIHSYLEQEVLYREALSMNLDHNDEIIKRRLVQKMEFLSDDFVSSEEPDLKILKAFYKHHSDKYQIPSRYTLKQVYFSRDKRVDARADAIKALQSSDPEHFGDPLSLPAEYFQTGTDKLATDLGKSFTMALDTLPTGQWAGPVQSGMGIHLVFIEDKSASGTSDFEEVVGQVREDYYRESGKEFKKELIVTMMKSYKITLALEESDLKDMLDEKY